MLIPQTRSDGSVLGGRLNLAFTQWRKNILASMKDQGFELTIDGSITNFLGIGFEKLDDGSFHVSAWSN
jgi:hypothetical protein